MSEIFDKLLIRILFTMFICLSFFLFKYAHYLFYPSHRKQILKIVAPNENFTNTLSLFGRILGLGIIYTSFEFNEYIGMAISTIHYFIWSSIGIILYLVTINLSDWIIFQNHKFKDEILKKKNNAYGIVSFANAIAIALILKKIFLASNYSIYVFASLWLLMTALYCGATRLYKYCAEHSFNSLLIQKNTGLAFSYAGFLLGNALILYGCFNYSNDGFAEMIKTSLIKSTIAILAVPFLFKALNRVFPDDKLEGGRKPDDLHMGIRDLSLFVFIGFFLELIIFYSKYHAKFQFISLFILVLITLYRIIHPYLFQFKREVKQWIRFIPLNSLDLIHLFSRLLGIAIIFGQINIYNFSSGGYFLFWCLLGFSFYLISILITENIIFYNFNYHDEILRKENFSYILVNFTNSVCQGLLISYVFQHSGSSFTSLIIFWLLILVLYGSTTRLFKYFNQLPFNSLMIQKNLGLGIAYSGFLLGNTYILSAAFNHEYYEISNFLIKVLLKGTLGVLIIPLFLMSLRWIFPVPIKTELNTQESTLNLGLGIYSFSLYLVAALLTSIIVGQIHFGTIYPFF